MAVTVQTMGVHYRWEIPDELRSQLRLAHELREDLVSLEYQFEDAKKAIWSSYPQVEAAEDALRVAEAALTEAAEAAAAERSRQRTKRITGSVADRLTAAKTAAKQAREQRRGAINGVRAAAKERLAAAATDLRAAQKDLYARYCQDGELHWATYNDVLDHHRTAAKRVAAQRASGRPARLRHHRFDGTGSVAVQLQRQAGQPQRTPALLADPAGKYRNVLMMPWTDPRHWETLTRAEQRRAGRGVVRMRCGTRDGRPVWIEIPVQQHRMLDADADITSARLTVTRTAGHLSARLSVTAKIGAPLQVDSGPDVAVHLGWRDTDTGIRVATWRSTAPLDVPAELRHVITSDSERMTGTVTVPSLIADRLARVDELRSSRDLSLDGMRDKLVSWLAEHGPVPHPVDADITLAAADVARWRSPARFAWLARVWRRSPPAGASDMAHVLEVWRRTDRALWETQEHGRRKALRYRDDLHRQVAAVLSDQARRIVIDDSSVAAIAGAPSDLPGEVDTRIAHRRTVAAPGLLRSAAVAAAVRDGVEVVIVGAKGLSRTHARCGHENPADDRYMSRVVPCDGCGGRYDQDASATVLMLRRASAGIVPQD